MFLGTLGLKEWMAQQERQHSVDISVQTKKDNLTRWFNSLVKILSHYARKDTNKIHLEGEFPTVMSVFKLYKKKCVEEGRIPLSWKILILFLRGSMYQSLHPENINAIFVYY